MIVQIEGAQVELSDQTVAEEWNQGRRLQPDELYCGKRNQGWQLGECAWVAVHVGLVTFTNKDEALKRANVAVAIPYCVYPKEIMYPYDAHECRRVLDMP